MESTSNQLGSPGNMFAHDNPSLEQTESKKNVDFLSLKPLDMFKIMSTLSSQNPHDQGAVSTSGRFPQKLRGLDVGSWGPVKASIPNGSETPINVAPTRARDSELESGINDIFTNTQNNMVLSPEYFDRTPSRINSHEEGNLKTGNSKRSPQPSSKGSFLAPNTIGPSIIPTSGLNPPPGQDIERSYTSQNEEGGPISGFGTVSTSGFYVIPKTPVIMNSHPQTSNYFAEKALSSDLHLEINQKENQILVQASQQRGPGLTFNQKETAPISLSVSKRRPGTKTFLRRTSAPAKELIDSGLGSGSDGEKSISSRVGSPVLGSAGYSFIAESRFAAIAQKGSKGSNNGAVIPKDTAIETPNQDRSKLSHDSSPKEILQEQQPTEHLIQPRELPNIGINDNLHFKNHLGIEEWPLISMSTTASGSGFGEPLGFKEAPGQPILDSLDIVDEDSDHTSLGGDKNENEENAEIQSLGNLKGVVLVSHKPYTKRITARRRARQGEFSKWCEEKSKEIQIEAIVERHQQDEEKMSARAMITSHKFIISDPREYQMELFEVAKERNTIAVLDTGSGKTLIACLLIRHMVDQELESRMLGRHRRVSFFLVDCVTLVFQQAAVLNCNIDAKIGKYCGNMGVDLWKKDIWDKILDDEQVIVMTADVLYNCLTHAFIKMEDINLLCFDEAHHAKKKHVYARIIKDFYICEPEDKRPKIFGMTASPVDARVDVVQAALELEELLHSKITTASDLMLLQSSVNRPKEEVAAYSKLQAPFQTQLCSKLHSKYGKYESFGKIFAFSKQCASELGPWCADQVWKFALSEQEYRKLKRKEERNANRQSSQNGLDLIEKDIQLLREAKVDVQNHIFDTPDPETSDLSSKVVLLHRFLRHVYAEENNNKCIIFVSRRYTARVLAALLKEVGSEYMKLGILIGSSSSGAGDENVTFRQQMVTVSQFRRGKLNCLIATSVAEEGLDIPDCSLIIRFDLYTTMIQYIQSRGRARHSKSRYIHMLEAGNGEHRRILGDVRSAEGIMRTFCQSLPEDRLLNEPPSSEHLVDENDRIYIEPESGAKLTFSSAMQIMGHYLGSLPHDGEDLSPPIYKVRRLGERSYICELLLPAGSPITCVGGTAMTTKSGAKRAAAFEACLQLRAKEHLNAHLLPKYRRRDIPKMANAHLALDSSKTQNYASKEKPTFWTIKDSTPPSQVWITVFLLSNQHEINERLLPIAIATREKLPNIPSFPIHSDRGALSDVISLRLNKPLDLTVEKLELLSRFTIRLFHDLFNKLFEQDDSTFPYWIAPCKGGEWNEKTLADDVLDWEMMACIMSSAQLEWDDKTPINNFVDRFLVDRRQRSRRFIVYDCDPTLSPKDPVPMRMSHGSPISSILDYSYNAGKKGPWKYIKWKVPETEPVLVADRLLHRLNYLDPPSEKDANTCTEAWICPSAFQVSMIPCHVIHMAMIFPSISTRIDAYLHAWDVCKLLGVEDLDLRLALEAITKDSDNSHEHNKNQVNPRKGMGNNYERLEFLGDCFLKVASSISLFAENHENDEYQLHVKRMLLVCNQHLFEKAKRINLPTYIQTEGFSRRWWYPATMKQILEKGTGKKIGKPGGLHRLADKSISDVCEALIGAALIDKGLDGATQMVTAILQTPEHLQKEWADYYKGYTTPGYQTALPSASQIKLAADIEKQIGYRFQSPKLLVSAFTHSSNPYSWEKVPCYQRLEFLGDSLLDLVCVRYIFNKYPEADPQWLTEHKMAMVSNKFLGAVSVVMGFHRKLKRVGQHLDIAIRDYAIEITEAKEKSNGAVDFWTSVSPPPKALPDILEAFIGALFVDSEFNYQIVEKFVSDFILPYFVDMTIYDNFAGQHPTTFLTQRMTDLGCTNWGYESEQIRTEEEYFIITGILIHSKVFAFGKGPSAKAARICASEAALEKLNGDGFIEFQSICDCKIVGEKEMKDLETAKGSRANGEEEEVVWLEE